ncbi:hypothetical protein HDU76_006756 [Blyttiomyces sp. JEL0837]|nr:hypothetical protein HDU76_006756 [Blyttiomyces sp. JEL0837]
MNLENHQRTTILPHSACSSPVPQQIVLPKSPSSSPHIQQNNDISLAHLNKIMSAAAPPTTATTATNSTNQHHPVIISTKPATLPSLSSPQAPFTARTTPPHSPNSVFTSSVVIPSNTNSNTYVSQSHMQNNYYHPASAPYNNNNTVPTTTTTTTSNNNVHLPAIKAAGQQPPTYSYFHSTQPHPHPSAQTYQHQHHQQQYDYHAQHQHHHQGHVMPVSVPRNSIITHHNMSPVIHQRVLNQHQHQHQHQQQSQIQSSSSRPAPLYTQTALLPSTQITATTTATTSPDLASSSSAQQPQPQQARAPRGKLPRTDRDRLRKISHSAIEKRRRDRTNLVLTRLKTIVPISAAITADPSAPPLHKLDVLERALDYIIELRGKLGMSSPFGPCYPVDANGIIATTSTTIADIGGGVGPSSGIVAGVSGNGGIVSRAGSSSSYDGYSGTEQFDHDLHDGHDDQVELDHHVKVDQEDEVPAVAVVHDTGSRKNSIGDASTGAKNHQDSIAMMSINSLLNL